jgi:hypothetical protein
VSGITALAVENVSLLLVVMVSRFGSLAFIASGYTHWLAFMLCLWHSALARWRWLFLIMLIDSL